MKSELFAKLEKSIRNFLDANCEDDHWDGYVYMGLAEDMARAASLVFDGCMKGQEYAEENK